MLRFTLLLSLLILLLGVTSCRLDSIILETEPITDSRWALKAAITAKNGDIEYTSSKKPAILAFSQNDSSLFLVNNQQAAFKLHFNSETGEAYLSGNIRNRSLPWLTKISSTTHYEKSGSTLLLKNMKTGDFLVFQRIK